MYSRALQVLQMSLQNQDLLFSDEILAAVYLLMTYEVNQADLTDFEIVDSTSFANRPPATVQRGMHMFQGLDVCCKFVVHRDMTVFWADECTKIFDMSS